VRVWETGSPLHPADFQLANVGNHDQAQIKTSPSRHGIDLCFPLCVHVEVSRRRRVPGCCETGFNSSSGVLLAVPRYSQLRIIVSSHTEHCRVPYPGLQARRCRVGLRESVDSGEFFMLHTDRMQRFGLMQDNTELRMNLLGVLSK